MAAPKKPKKPKATAKAPKTQKQIAEATKNLVTFGVPKAAKLKKCHTACQTELGSPRKTKTVAKPKSKKPAKKAAPAAKPAKKPTRKSAAKRVVKETTIAAAPAPHKSATRKAAPKKPKTRKAHAKKPVASTAAAAPPTPRAKKAPKAKAAKPRGAHRSARGPSGRLYKPTKAQLAKFCTTAHVTKSGHLAINGTVVKTAAGDPVEVKHPRALLVEQKFAEARAEEMEQARMGNPLRKRAKRGKGHTKKRAASHAKGKTRRGHKRASMTRRHNPTFTVMQTAAAVITTGVTFTLVDLLDRFLATRAAPEGKDAFYGSDAAIRISQKPGLLRLGVQGGLSVAGFLAAYYVKNASAKAVLGGIATGAGIHMVFQLLTSRVMPMIFKATTNKTDDKVLGARLYPIEQAVSQQNLDAVTKKQEEAIKNKAALPPTDLFMAWLSTPPLATGDKAKAATPPPVPQPPYYGLAGAPPQGRFLPAARPQIWPETHGQPRFAAVGALQAEPVAQARPMGGRPPGAIRQAFPVGVAAGKRDCKKNPLTNLTKPLIEPGHIFRKTGTTNFDATEKPGEECPCEDCTAANGNDGADSAGTQAGSAYDASKAYAATPSTNVQVGTQADSAYDARKANAAAPSTNVQVGTQAGSAYDARKANAAAPSTNVQVGTRGGMNAVWFNATENTWYSADGQKVAQSQPAAQVHMAHAEPVASAAPPAALAAAPSQIAVPAGSQARLVAGADGNQYVQFVRGGPSTDAPGPLVAHVRAAAQQTNELDAQSVYALQQQLLAYQVAGLAGQPAAEPFAPPAPPAPVDLDPLPGVAMVAQAPYEAPKAVSAATDDRFGYMGRKSKKGARPLAIN